ncbi:hypothetical protein BH20ACI1_BH20ACI1_13840 [soil metagenome]
MLKILLMIFMFSALQDSPDPIVNRVFVETPYNTSIIYEYANDVLVEDQPIKDETIKCFVSELKDTGLFTDVQVSLKKIDDSQRVNVFIKPIWTTQKDSLFVEEIDFQNFEGIDTNQLRKLLRQKGLGKNSVLFQRNFLNIKVKTQETISEMDGLKNKEDIEEKTSELSLRIKLISPGKVKVTIIAGKNLLCR